MKLKRNFTCKHELKLVKEEIKVHVQLYMYLQFTLVSLGLGLDTIGLAKSIYEAWQYSKRIHRFQLHYKSSKGYSNYWLIDN